MIDIKNTKVFIDGKFIDTVTKISLVANIGRTDHWIADVDYLAEKKATVQTINGSKETITYAQIRKCLYVSEVKLLTSGVALYLATDDGEEVDA